MNIRHLFFAAVLGVVAVIAVPAAQAEPFPPRTQLPLIAHQKVEKAKARPRAR